MQIQLRNARILQNGRFVEGVMWIRDGKIEEISQHAPELAEGSVDVNGAMVVPGFVDLHVHGGGGACAMDGSARKILQMCNAHAQHGTTTILPTAWTAPLPEIFQTIDAVKEAKQLSCDATIAGINLEGPYLSPAQSGAQRMDALQIPAHSPWKTMAERWDGIRMVGIAPELEGALEMGQALSNRGIVVSVAHSDADEADMRAAVCHGFSDVTHLYSGCSTFRRVKGFRVPGVVESALASDNLSVQVIGDGAHLPLAMIRLIYRCKGSDGMYWITDALESAATSLQEEATYYLQNGMKVVYEDGVMKLANREAFAGSVATMDMVIRVGVMAGIPLAESIKMATETPAKRIGLEHSKGRIAKGYDADLVLLADTLEVKGCISRGRWIRNDLGKDNLQ